MPQPDWSGDVVAELPATEPTPAAVVAPAPRDEAQDWGPHWGGMPEFVQHDLTPWKSVKVHFASEADMKAFARLVEQRVPGMGPGGSIWYPKAAVGHFADKRYVSVPVEQGDEPEWTL